MSQAQSRRPSQLGASFNDGTSVRNRVHSGIITTVKALTRRMYLNSDRELRQKPFGGNTARRVLALALSTFHGKLRRPHKDRGVHISGARYFGK